MIQILIQAEELSQLTGIEVALIIVDGLRVDTYFSSANMNDRFKPQLADILQADLVIPKESKSTQTDDIPSVSSSKAKTKKR